MRIRDVTVKNVTDMQKQKSHHHLNLKWTEKRHCVSNEKFPLAHHPLYFVLPSPLLFSNGEDFFNCGFISAVTQI